MKTIKGDGQRGPIRVRPKKLEDAKKATNLEKLISYVLRERITNTIVYGVPDPSPAMKRRFARMYPGFKS